MNQLQEFKLRLLDTFDVEELCDILSIGTSDLLNQFEDKVLDYASEAGWTETSAVGPGDFEESNETYKN